MDRVPLERKVLSENDRIAAELRARFQEHGVLCLNIISSPGSGKTTLLERTLAALTQRDRVAVLTGDIQTENDANRLKRFHFPVKQITTGGTCHLDARMIERHLADWKLEDLDLLFIENVGNLSIQLRSRRGGQGRGLERDRRRRQTVEISFDILQVRSAHTEQNRFASLRSV